MALGNYAANFTKQLKKDRAATKSDGLDDDKLGDALSGQSPPYAIGPGRRGVS
jgi:hypothetical protein